MSNISQTNIHNQITHASFSILEKFLWEIYLHHNPQIESIATKNSHHVYKKHAMTAN
jgi:hypothetical protein